MKTTGTIFRHLLFTFGVPAWSAVIIIKICMPFGMSMRTISLPPASELPVILVFSQIWQAQVEWAFLHWCFQSAPGLTLSLTLLGLTLTKWPSSSFKCSADSFGSKQKWLCHCVCIRFEGHCELINFFYRYGTEIGNVKTNLLPVSFAVKSCAAICWTCSCCCIMLQYCYMLLYTVSILLLCHCMLLY